MPGTAVTVTYSFMSSAPSDLSAYDRNGLTTMTTAQKAAVVAALASWSAVANIKFVQVTDSGASSGGQIRFAQNDQGTTSAAYTEPFTTGGNLDHAYVFVNDDSYYNNSGHYQGSYDFTSGSYANLTLVHEIGHALGFKHPGDYNAGSGGSVGPYLPSATDSNNYTVMSYNQSTLANNNSNNIHANPNAPMLYDIQAMQYIYGANMTYHTGNDTYSFNNSTIPICIWDAGGTNTFDFSACTSQVYINLNAGTFSQTKPNAENVSIAYGVTIQNAVGGSDGGTIVGNAAGDHLTGGAGQYVFVPGGGVTVIDGTSAGSNDTVQFSGPRSQYSIGLANGTVTVVETSGNKADGTVSASHVALLQFTDGTVAVSSLSSTPVVLSAAVAAQSASIGLIAVSDSAANVLGNIAGLESLAGAGNLASITLTDAATATLTVAAGTVAADQQVLRAISGSITLVEQGTSGNDSFIGHAGTVTVTGGGGHDSIALQGASSAYTVTATGGGGVTVVDGTASRDGTVNAGGVNYLTFTDKTVVVANADQANLARLYQAAFGRAPDTPGLNAWEDVYAADVSAAAKAQGALTSLSQTALWAGGISVAQGFTSSAEFLAKYNGLDNSGFLTQLYNNVFARAPDQPGLNAWLSAMNGGYTKEMVLVGFAESAENIAGTTFSATHSSGWLFSV